MGLLQSKRFRKIAGFWVYYQQFRAFCRASRKSEDNRFTCRWQDRMPCLSEKTETFSFDRHYIYHTAWAARILACTRPARHVDVASSLYFSSIVSAFVPVDFYEFRPPALYLSGFTAHKGTLLQLPLEDKSVCSLSCMHVTEHVGLGRYGDPIDPAGDRKTAAELQRVLAPGGQLLFVVPMGQGIIRFNAHRLYTFSQVCELFTGAILEEFTFVDEREGSLRTMPAYEAQKTRLEGCGCFLFRRP
jgi:SAM-dependent methyltransferase